MIVNIIISLIFLFIWIFVLLVLDPKINSNEEPDIFNTLDTVRYATPSDTVIIDNKKDCASELTLCKMNPSSLEESCRGCKQLHSNCVHFDKDTIIEMNGIQTNISKNQDDEGYCLVDYSEPTSTCGIWGFWILTQLNDNSFAWICKCRYPNIFAQKTLWDDCTEQVACEGGVLENAEEGLPAELKCTCPENKIEWQGEDNVPHCRMALARDGAFYNSTFEKYFDNYIDNKLEYMLTPLPASWNMPNVWVVNPFFLGLNGLEKGWQGDVSTNKMLSGYMNNSKYPVIYRHPFMGDTTINPVLDVSHGSTGIIGEFNPISYPRSYSYIYSKIVIDPDNEGKWYDQPWGWWFGSWSNVEHQRQNIQGYTVPLVDPYKDIFSGQLGIMPLDNNLWVWSPLLRPRVLVFGSYLLTDKAVTGSNFDFWLLAKDSPDLNIVRATNLTGPLTVGQDKFGYNYVNKVPTTDVTEYMIKNGNTLEEKILTFLPLAIQNNYQSYDDYTNVSSKTSQTYRYAYAPYPIPTGDRDYSGKIICISDPNNDICNPHDLIIHPIISEGSDTTQARTWLANYLTKFPNFLKHLMNYDISQFNSKTWRVSQVSKYDVLVPYSDDGNKRGSQRLELKYTNTEGSGAYAGMINYTRSFQPGTLFPFPNRWDGHIETTWSPPKYPPPQQRPFINLNFPNCKPENYQYMYIKGSGFVCGEEEKNEGKVKRKNHAYETPDQIEPTNSNTSIDLPQEFVDRLDKQKNKTLITKKVKRKIIIFPEQELPIKRSRY